MEENKDQMKDNIYELVIVGGGPAGCAAAVYAARKRIKTLMILGEWGGQSIVSTDIQNWIGTNHISGSDLANSLKNHVLEYKDNSLTVKENTKVINILKNLADKNTESNNYKDFEIEIEGGDKFYTKSILIATGSNRKKLNAVNADKFEHKGLTYCATCDGPIFADMNVVVVGGGNAAFETSVQLLAYCNSVTQLVRGDTSADEMTIESVLKNPKFKLISKATPKEIHGGMFVDGITYTDTTNPDSPVDIKLNVSGIFVEIGQVPATEFAADVCELNSYKNVKVNPLTQATSIKGIWAAGDCTDVLYHQNNIAVGDAVKAIEDIYQYLRK